MAEFVPRTSLNYPTLLSEDLEIPHWYFSSNPFYNNGYGMPNCTAYAWGRYCEARNAVKNNLPLGDAKTWYQTAIDNGFDVGSEPRLGAIACYAPIDPSSSRAGHVAIVEIIQQRNGETVITTSNSYYGGAFWDIVETTETQGFNYISGYYLQGFIYNDVDPLNISAEVVSAILGNWMQESALNPAVWESLFDPADNNIQIYPDRWTYQFQNQIIGGQSVGTGGFGLGQWTNVNTPNGRLYNLHQYCVENEYQDGDGYAELYYFLEENLWMPKPSRQRTPARTLTEFLSLKGYSVEDLTYDFLICWEGIDRAYEQRKQNALFCYNYILDNYTVDPTTLSWTKGNFYLNNEQRNENLLLIYFWFRDNFTGGEGGKGEKRKMPVWMMLDYYFDM